MKEPECACHHVSEELQGWGTEVTMCLDGDGDKLNFGVTVVHSGSPLGGIAVHSGW
jgi:hypothetical protein